MKRNCFVSSIPTPGAAPCLTQPTSRPRIEGEREGEIFTAVVALLVEAGYDKLTFDAVATAVRASKATLYRRWPTKADLVLDAVAGHLPAEPEVDDDTGSLRGDLLAQACGPGGLCDDSPAVLGALIPAMHRDRDLFAAFRERFVQPKLERNIAAFERARDRGEVGPGADLHLLANTLSGDLRARHVRLRHPRHPRACRPRHRQRRAAGGPRDPRPQSRLTPRDFPTFFDREDRTPCPPPPQASSTASPTEPAPPSSRAASVSPSPSSAAPS